MKKIQSIGIIMDGNRRWAKEKGLKAWDGHRAGVDALKKVKTELPRLRQKYGVEYVVLYGFSTENWKRSKEEIDALFGIFEETLEEFITQDDDFIFKVIGERERLPARVQELIVTLEEKTSTRTGSTLVLALSYGGRTEILSAVNDLIKKGKPVSEDEFTHTLWSSNIPDPDLIIRVGGERRLSNFLTWSSAYSELFFTNTLWPDFTTEELEEIFDDYATREQRHGK